MTVPNTVIDQPIEDTFMIQRLGQWVYAETTKTVTTTTNPYLSTSWMDTNPDVPNIGAAWSTSDIALQDLRLEEREARVFNTTGSRYRVRIRLVYRFSPFAGNPGAPTGTGTHRRALRGGASLAQVRTMLDMNEMPILVNFDTTDDEGDPVTLTSTPQVVDVTISQPVTSRRVVLQTNDPEQVTLDWVGFVNATPWASGDAQMWMCIDCQFQDMNLDAMPRWYDFQFEFMLSTNDPSIGWRYVVPYRDEAGRIPEGVVMGNGMDVMDWHPTKDFNTLF